MLGPADRHHQAWPKFPLSYLRALGHISRAKLQVYHRAPEEDERYHCLSDDFLERSYRP